LIISWSYTNLLDRVKTFELSVACEPDRKGDTERSKRPRVKPRIGPVPGEAGGPAPKLETPMTISDFYVYNGSNIGRIEQGVVGSSRTTTCFLCVREPLYVRNRRGYCFFCRMKSEFKLTDKQGEAFEFLFTKKIVVFERWDGRWEKAETSKGRTFKHQTFKSLAVKGLASMEIDGTTFTPIFDMLKDRGFLFEKGIPRS